MRIEHDLITYQVLSDRRSRAVATRLEYRDETPAEVRVVFHTDRRDPVSWVLPRNLLIDGLSRPCAAGDVRIRPYVDGDRHLVSLRLDGEDGAALIEIPAAEIGAFVLRTLRSVPRGQESRPPNDACPSSGNHASPDRRFARAFATHG